MHDFMISCEIIRSLFPSQTLQIVASLQIIGGAADQYPPPPLTLIQTCGINLMFILHLSFYCI